jgi:hypothetical protein
VIKPQVQVHGTSKGITDSVFTASGITITMPQRTAPSSAPAWHQQRWNEYYNALKSHEDGHDSRFRLPYGANGGFGEAHKEFWGQPMTKPSVNTVMNKVSGSAQKTSDDYDTATTSGQTGSPPVVMDRNPPAAPPASTTP